MVLMTKKQLHETRRKTWQHKDQNEQHNNKKKKKKRHNIDTECPFR